jgi:hypothetical protein
MSAANGAVRHIPRPECFGKPVKRASSSSPTDASPATFKMYMRGAGSIHIRRQIGAPALLFLYLLHYQMLPEKRLAELMADGEAP